MSALELTGWCPRCHGPVFAEDANIEAFEVTGQILCDECADKAVKEAKTQVEDGK